MKKIRLYVGLIAFIFIVYLAHLSTFKHMDCVPDLHAGDDLEALKAIVSISQNAVGAKFFSTIVQSNKKESTGALKVTVTSKFLRESQSTRQSLMQSVYDSWRQMYKGPDEAMIAFVDSKNRAVGVATKSACLSP